MKVPKIELIKTKKTAYKSTIYRRFCKQLNKLIYQGFIPNNRLELAQ